MNPLPQSDFSDLDDLLAESMQTARESAEVRAAQARQRLGKQSKVEQAADAARIAAWQARNDWASVAQVAMFETVVCKHCDSATTIFTGLFVKQQGRNNPSNTRWMPPSHDLPLAGLPKRTAIREREVAWCSTCIGEQGFNFDEPESLT